MPAKRTKTTRDYPDLRIVPIGRVIPHELHDEQRAMPLVKKLRDDGILKSPILVTTLSNAGDETEYMILDGTNRQISLELLGIGYALVQVVDYREPSVQLRSWNHVVTNVTPDELQAMIIGTRGLQPRITRLSTAVEEFETEAIQGYCVLSNNKAITLTGKHTTLAARAEYLTAIVASYITHCTVNRVTSADIRELKAAYPDMAGVIIYPPFRPEEILELVRNGLRVPAGITRHLINGRALRVNYPLDLLSSALSLEEKNRRLLKWMQGKFTRREVRFYEEPTYLFDE